MGLSKYHEKRNFKKTAEPKGHEHKASKAGGVFIVQKHDASRLHYDLRLEMEGVLRSWAVPKGPSLDPKDKRLAVQVEDHPIEYGSFEGIIPKGEYGGGTVMLWDHGTWKPDGDPVSSWRSGKLRFSLKGQKLHGNWVLLRLRGNDADDRNWLLVKENDDHARNAKEFSVTESLPKSVTTGRGLDEIARGAKTRMKGGAGGMRIWNSNPPEAAKNASVTKTRNTRTASKPAVLDVSNIAGVRKAKMPAAIKPQLATLIKHAPEGAQWIHEIKFDGYRAICFLQKSKARLLTRNGNDWTDRFSPIAEAAMQLPANQAILDGEIVLPGANGATDFQALQNALNSGRKEELLFYAFDLLYLDGYDLTGSTLLDRKLLLKSLLERANAKTRDRIRYSEHFEESGARVLKSACKMHLEGIISKLQDASYVQTRSNSWVKTKCVQRQEFVIGGYTDPEGGRSDFGALLVGVPEKKSKNGNIRYAGKVGTGFTNKSLGEIASKLRSLHRRESPFIDVPHEAWVRRVHWVKPQLVGEIEFTEITSEGRLRHPSFQGLRDDKRADEVVLEVPEPMKLRTKASRSSRKPKSLAKKQPAGRRK